MGNACSAEVKVYKAAKRNDVEALKSLVRQAEHLRREYNVNVSKFLEWEDPNGRTPLHIAAARGNVQCVELLLQHGANINHINNKLEGGTALHEAVANQQMSVASLLVQRGCMPTLENIKGLTPLDLAIKSSNAQMLRLLEQHAWFRSHLMVKVPTLGGMKKQWSRRWAVVVPRYPCPSLPNERRRGYHVMLLLYKRDDHSTPCARIFLNGATATPALPKEARGAQRPSAMYPLQCIVTLHLSHAPTPVAFKANGRAGFVLHLRPETSSLSHCSQLRQLMDIVNTATGPAPGSSPLGPAVPTIPHLIPASPSTMEALPPLLPPHSPSNASNLSPASSYTSSGPVAARPSRRNTFGSGLSIEVPPSPPADPPSARIAAAPGSTTMQDEEVARRLQRQFDAEAAELLSSVVPGPLGRAQSARAMGVPMHMPGEGGSRRTASVGGVPTAGGATPAEAAPMTPSSSRHGKSPSAPPLGGGLDGVPDSELCVICLEAPQESGFLHGSTVHRCCCRTCALKLKRNNTQLCPLCREPIDHVVLAVY